MHRPLKAPGASKLKYLDFKNANTTLFGVVEFQRAVTADTRKE